MNIQTHINYEIGLCVILICIFVGGSLSLSRAHTTTIATATNDFKTDKNYQKKKKRKTKEEEEVENIMCVAVCAVHVTHNQLEIYVYIQRIVYILRAALLARS